MEINQNLTNKAQRDCQLVRMAIETNDQKAYAELMNNYRDTLYFMMLKMTNNEHDADDLTIEAFGKAFRSLHQYSSDYAFSTWLFKIASNNCIDFIRRKRKNTMAIDNSSDISENWEFANKVADEYLNPEQSIIREQKIKLMREIVKSLKPHYRQLIELRYFEENSYEEIAVKLELPLGTVKAQLFRAREFLLQILKGSADNI